MKEGVRVAVDERWSGTEGVPVSIKHCVMYRHSLLGADQQPRMRLSFSLSLLSADLSSCQPGSFYTQ